MKKFLVFAIIFSCHFFLAGMAMSATIFVDAANDTGIEDGSQTSPFKDIQEAIKTAVNGDVVSVAPGIYYGTLEMKYGVKVVGEQGPEVTIIDAMGNSTGIAPPDGYYSKIDIAGFTIRNASVLIYPYNRSYYNFAAYCIVDNCILDGGYYGIRANYGAQTTVTRTLFKNMNTAISGWNGDRVICNNVTIDNVNMGIYISYIRRDPGLTLNNTTISNCKIAINLPTGSRFYWAPRVAGSNNNFWNCDIVVKHFTSPSYPVIDDMIATTMNDPMFIDMTAGDYHLQSGSPLIDAGIDIGLPYSGSAPDVGAFENDELSLVDLTQVLIESVQDVPPTGFKNASEQRRNALLNKLAAVLEEISSIAEDTPVDEQLEILNNCAKKLRNDILAKADGTYGGNPKNDWITEADEQQVFYPEVLMLAEDIENEIAALSAGS